MTLLPSETRRARAGVFDLLRLGVALGAEKFKGERADPAAAGCRWANALELRDGGRDIDVALPGVSLALVRDEAHSEELLSATPERQSYHAGHFKREAMQFLAPHALTIAQDDAWRQLRPFNEAVLGTGAPHPFAQAFLSAVRDAFSASVHSIDDVRAAMGQAMVRVVLGDVSPDFNPATDAATLFNVSQSPIRRTLLGFRYKARRDRLYELLAHKWQAAAQAAEGDHEQTLIALAARTGGEGHREALLEQIPHWMFTFTGSGTALLTRTLCMITSRPAARDRVIAEARAAGPLGDTTTMQRLPFLEACLLETGRLFPPVTRTFHASPHAPSHGERGPEYVHYFPMLQRDDRLGHTVHVFHPERWLEPTLDDAARASNLFLRGPRACPGMDLILFVCRAALVREISELGVDASQARLRNDPLPVSFPAKLTSFTTQGHVT